MNITLAIPEDIVSQARAYATEHHTSMNQLIREHLQRFANSTSRQKDAEDAMEFLRSLPGTIPKDQLLTRSDYSERE